MAAKKDAAAAEAKRQIKADGKWGSKTTKAAEKVFGLPETGIIYNQDESLKEFCIACIPVGSRNGSFEWRENPSFGSALISKIQEWCYASIDGELGPKTIKAMQRKLGVNHDGYLGEITVKAFQNWLNEQLQ